MKENIYIKINKKHEYGSDYRNLSLRENKGYLIYEVGNLGGNSPEVIKILIFVTLF